MKWNISMIANLIERNRNAHQKRLISNREMRWILLSGQTDYFEWWQQQQQQQQDEAFA